MLSKLLLKNFQRLVYVINYMFSTQINENELYKKHLLNTRVTIFDIGSNLGNFSQQLSRSLKNKTLEVHSFEPLQELLNSQNLKRGKLYKYEYVISNEEGSVNFFEHEISSQSSLLINDKMGDQEVKKVEKKAITLDQALNKANVNKVDILKLDTEGNEYEILKSSEHLLNNKIFNIIKVEISFLIKNKFSDKNFNLINNLMSKSGYVFVGHSNAHYQDNKILFFDGFYINNNLLS